MISRYLKIIITVLVCSFLLLLTKSYAQTDIDERRAKAVMRMIGHEVLLSAGDSVSRVLAIEKEGNRYQIQFESEFLFYPGELVYTIHQIIEQSELPTSYLIEVESCKTKEVIYSHEIKEAIQEDLIPCKSRNQNKACYKLFITFIDENSETVSLLPYSSPSENDLTLGTRKSSDVRIALLIVPFLFLVGTLIYLRKKKTSIPVDPDLFLIGKYQFNKRNMMLSDGKNVTELTGKEADLLYLLYSSANKTLERENILNVVWGDEGDYVGRTLDVFISKLRKKLGDDPSLKIVNIRGIGYKFVMNNLN